MLNRTLAVSLGVTLAWGFATGLANAQGIGKPPGSPPAFSPYLNLLRRDNSTALNYYGLVRPQVEARSAIQQLQQQVQTAQQSTSGFEGSATALPTTGHRTFFLNRAHPYFGAGGSGQAPGGGSRTGAAAPASSGPTISAPMASGGRR